MRVIYGSSWNIICLKTKHEVSVTLLAHVSLFIQQFVKISENQYTENYSDSTCLPSNHLFKHIWQSE